MHQMLIHTYVEMKQKREAEDTTASWLCAPCSAFSKHMSGPSDKHHPQPLTAHHLPPWALLNVGGGGARERPARQPPYPKSPFPALSALLRRHSYT